MAMGLSLSGATEWTDGIGIIEDHRVSLNR